MTLGSFARKARRAAPGVTAIMLATIATGCSAGCSASISVGRDKAGGTYSNHGVSFTIPKGWRRLSDLTIKTKSGSEIWSEGFAAEPGYDLVGVTAYATKIVVTRKNAKKVAPQVAATMRNLFAAAGGRVLNGPIVTSLRGMAGYRFETTFPGQSGDMLESRLLLVWNGHTEYFFNCQHRAGSSLSAEIEHGCGTIESSFKLD